MFTFGHILRIEGQFGHILRIDAFSIWSYLSLCNQFGHILRIDVRQFGHILRIDDSMSSKLKNRYNNYVHILSKNKDFY